MIPKSVGRGGGAQIDACLHSKHVFASHMHPAAHAAGGSLRSTRVDLFLDAVVSSTSTCVALQLQAALGNACTIFPTIDLAVPIPEEEKEDEEGKQRKAPRAFHPPQHPQAPTCGHGSWV